MNLNIKPRYISSLLKESLNIENFEYSYLIPILAQTAEYSGDTEVVAICDLMSAQLKEYLNITSLFLFSTYKKEELNQKVSYSLNSINNKEKKNNINNRDNFNIYNIKTLNNEIKLENNLFVYENSKNRKLHSVIKKFDKVDNHVLSHVKSLNKQFFKNNIYTSFGPKINRKNLHIGNEKNDILLLKYLHYRKFLKANNFYPLLSEISLKQGMVFFTKILFEMTNSEKKTSKLLINLIDR